MARRIGFYSLRKFAGGVCKYVVQFGPAIKLAYPSAPLLHAALDAALLACQILIDEINDVAPVGV